MSTKRFGPKCSQQLYLKHWVAWSCLAQDFSTQKMRDGNYHLSYSLNYQATPQTKYTLGRL